MKRFAFVLLFLVACNRAEAPKPAAQAAAPAGNPQQGQQLIAQYGCNVCHIIPGIAGPGGTLAPSLQGVASRPAISYGRVQNTPANLVQFIQNPGSLNPQSTMPPMGVSPADAQHIVAYLQTLK